MIESKDGAASAASFLHGAAERSSSRDLLYYSGYYQERAHEYAKALSNYDAVLESDPGDSAALYRRAVCLKALGRNEEAREAAERAAELDNSTGGADHRAQALADELAGPLPDWGRLAQLEERFPESDQGLAAHRELAAAYLRMERWAQAGAHYAWCETHGGKAEDSVLAGLCSLRLERFSQAVAHGARAVELSDRQIVKQVGWGRLLQEKGYWADAAEAYRWELEKRGSADPTLVHACGFAYSRQYQWCDAKRYLRIAVQLAPSNTKYWYDLGFVLERMKDYDAASIAYASSFDPSTEAPGAFRRYRYIAALVAAHRLDEAAEAIPQTEAPREGEEANTAFWKVEDLRGDLAYAIAHSDSAMCLAVARTAAAVGDDTLAVEAFSAAEVRAVEHDPALYRDYAAALVRLGEREAGVKRFLQSRQFGQPSGLNVADYLRTKAARLSAVYLDYVQTRAVEDDVVLYESSHGASITCSVRPLLEHMLATDRGRAMTHVVVVNDRARVPETLLGRSNVTFVPRESNLYLRYLATAKWLISNNTFPPYFSRRDEQKYLNMWHGTPMKTLGRDIRSGVMDYRNASRNFLHVTHLAPPNDFTARVLLDRYDVARIFPGELAVPGSPRMDVTLNLPEARRAEIRKALGAGVDDRIVLFAPTWRGDLAHKTVDIDQIEADLAAMSSEHTVVAFRGHPLMEAGLGGLSTDAVTVPEDIDTNELLGAVDVVVSDYSSIAIDSIGGGVRTILYVYDLAEYEADRGLYMDLGDLPVELAHTREELTTLLQDRHGGVPDDLGVFREMWAHEDGHATERVARFFFDGADIGQTEPSRDRRKTEVLLFEGHFIPNGVTSSARELNKFLTGSGVGVTLAVEGAKIVPFPERAAIFAEGRDDVYALPTVGAALRSPEETWLNSMFMRHHELWSDEQRDLLDQSYAREFRRLYGAAEFDTVVCFEGYTRYWVNLFANAPASTRKVIYLHNDMWHEYVNRFPYLRGIFAMYGHYDVIASVSPSVHETNVGRFGRSTASYRQEWAVAQNLIDPAQILELAKAPLAEDFQAFLAQPHAKVFIDVARLSVEKGQEDLLDAFTRRPDDDLLVLVGGGPLEGDLKRRARQLGIASRVFFAGRQENPFPYVAASDAFVLPSHYEGQGIVVLEAIVLGVPVVARDIPGPRSILEHGGGVLAGNTVESIAQGMAQVVTSAVEPFDVDRYLGEARAQHEHALGVTTGAGDSE